MTQVKIVGMMMNHILNKIFDFMVGRIKLYGVSGHLIASAIYCNKEMFRNAYQMFEGKAHKGFYIQIEPSISEKPEIVGRKIKTVIPDKPKIISRPPAVYKGIYNTENTHRGYGCG